MVILSISVCESYNSVFRGYMDEELQSVKKHSKISSLFCDQPSAVRNEAPDLKTEDVIMCCLLRDISHLRWW
jgi:hypothetical protein